MNKIILCLSFLLVSSVTAQSVEPDLQRFGENFQPFNLGEAQRKREETELIRQQRILIEEYRRTIELENQRRERELIGIQQSSQARERDAAVTIALLETRIRLLEAQARQSELEAQARQQELEIQRQSQPSRTTERDVVSKAAMSSPINIQMQQRVKNAQYESRQVLYAERVTYCMEERKISKRYCQSIASNELAVAFDGYIRAEPYRSRQTQYVEAKMAH